MTGSTTFDETSNDHERFEAKQLAQDYDATRPTADLTDAAARQFVNEGVVIPVVERRVLIHNPTGEAFDSITQLAVFHRGWTAARAADAEEPRVASESYLTNVGVGAWTRWNLLFIVIIVAFYTNSFEVYSLLNGRDDNDLFLTRLAVVPATRVSESLVQCFTDQRPGILRGGVPVIALVSGKGL